MASSSERRNIPPVTIVIEGLIGSGKTTLLEECLIPILSRRGLRVTLIQEPVKKWEESGILKQFYEDPSRRAYQFQTRAFHDRVRESQEKYRKYKDCTDVFLLERSVFSDILFMKTLLEQGTIDETEYRDYADLWTMWEEVMPFRPDLFVYLKPDMEIVMARVQERSRDGESAVTREYQTLLEKKHDEFLGKEFVLISDSHYIPCFHLKTNANFRDDPDVREKITDLFQIQIDRIRKSKEVRG